MLSLKILTLGALQTNCYLLYDQESQSAVIVDPADDVSKILQELNFLHAHLQEIWITHAHFDHIGAANSLASVFNQVPIALHPDDLPLWKMDGGAPLFGLPIKAGPEPQKLLSHNCNLNLGNYTFKVLHVPGHTPGHVVYYCAEQNVLLSGDVLFKGGVGRTDLPGGSWQQLMNGIRQHLLILPDETLVYPGHGPETSIGKEKRENPFLGGDVI